MIGLLLWTAAILLWAGRSWTATIPLKTPDKTPAQNAQFRCGAPLSGDTGSSLLSPQSTALPLSDAPCGQRTTRRDLVYIDVALAGVIVLVLARGRSRRRRATAEPAVF
jgi:hypothetical protein